MNEWTPISWQTASSLSGHELDTVRIDLAVSPFYAGTRYAVRRIGAVLNVRGEWEHEPIPSSRDDAFYERCRFTLFETAKRAADKAMAKAGA